VTNKLEAGFTEPCLFYMHFGQNVCCLSSIYDEDKGFFVFPEGYTLRVKTDSGIGKKIYQENKAACGTCLYMVRC